MFGFRAPELIFGATDYTTNIDVWSAGCVFAGKSRFSYNPTKEDRQNNYLRL